MLELHLRRRHNYVLDVSGNRSIWTAGSLRISEMPQCAAGEQREKSMAFDRNAAVAAGMRCIGKKQQMFSGNTAFDRKSAFVFRTCFLRSDFVCRA